MDEQERPERCKTCRFWEADDDQEREAPEDRTGHCRRFPPACLNHALVEQEVIDFAHDLPGYESAINESHSEIAWPWPVTLAADWCGEWREKPSARAKPATGAEGRAAARKAVRESGDPAAQPVGLLMLGARARKACYRLRVNTVGDLVARTAGELLEVKGSGFATVEEIRQALADVGLSLREP